MRKAFAETLVALAEKRPDIWLLFGDLGYGVFDEFVRRFPERAINCGVAEANMMGVAAGLAACGKMPWVYSITNFVTLRCLEQLRNDVCYPNANVKVIGVGVDRDYGTLGYSHWGIEDDAIVRTLPNIRVLNPQNAGEVRAATILAAERAGPVYIRLRRE